MQLRSFALTMGMLGCGGGGDLTTPPTPHPDYENVCRCDGRLRPLAVVRVESSPTAFRDERYSIERSGNEFDIQVERVLSANEGTVGAPAVSTRVRARQHLTHSGGRPIFAGTTADHPQYTRVEAGQRLLAYLHGPDPDVANRWTLNLLATMPASDVLPRQLFSFPAGTPMSRVFDLAEWTCTSEQVRGDCRLPDGGSRGDASD